MKFNLSYLKTAAGHRLILFLVVLAFILWFIFRPVKMPEKDKVLIDHLQHLNDSLRTDNKKAVQQVIDSERKQDSILTIIRNTDWKIYHSKEVHEKIIHHWDTAGIIEQQRFFDQRYPAK